MRILVVGGTGAIGRRLVPGLVAGGHEVAATTRRAARRSALSALGAEPVVLDALDADAVDRTIADRKPEIVLCEVTSLTGDRTRYSELIRENARVREAATRNVVAASRRAGVRRVVAQSIASLYGPGEGLATEDEPLRDDPRAAAQAALDRDVVASSREGIVARYGFLYGPGTWYAGDGAVADELRARAFAWSGCGEDAFVHVDDAASATVVLCERAAPGIYNVVDDDPAPQAEWVPAFAEAVGAPTPVAGEPAGAPGRGISNAKLRALGWSPAHPTWRRGFRDAI